MSKLIAYWKSSPVFRALLKAVVVAVIGYAFDVYRGANDFVDWQSFAVGLGGAAIFAVAQFLGLEPFVGVKPDNVKVPGNAQVDRSLGEY